MAAAEMGESRRNRNMVARLMNLVMLLVLVRTNPTLAWVRPSVKVRLEAERHVCERHVRTDQIFLPIRLTYQIDRTHEGQCVKIPIAPGVAGLAVEYIGNDGKRSTQSMPAETSWSSDRDTLELRSSTLAVEASVWISLGSHFDFSRPGLYRLSYAHPWAVLADEPNSPLFESDGLTIACVSHQRLDQLHMMLSKNPDLALASYKFKHPPAAREAPKQRRTVAKIVDEAIEKGAPYDKVLLLLGSPDRVTPATAGKPTTFGWWGQSWHYETSPVGAFVVMFENGSLVKKIHHADRHVEISAGK